MKALASAGKDGYLQNYLPKAPRHTAPDKIGHSWSALTVLLLVGNLLCDNLWLVFQHTNRAFLSECNLSSV